MTEGIAREQLVSIFARWRNLEDEKHRIGEDSKELFAEAKGNGFAPKALRLAFRQAAKADEPLTDAEIATVDLADTYLAALLEPARARPAPARVEIIEKIPPSDSPKTRPVIASLERPATAKASAEPASEANAGGATMNPRGPAEIIRERGESGAPPYPGDDDPLGPDMPEYLRRVS